MRSENLFEWAPQLSTSGHKHKLYKKISSTSVRHYFLTERIVKVWNFLPDEVDLVQLQVLLNMSVLTILLATVNMI